MCITSKVPTPRPSVQKIAAVDNREAYLEQDLADRLRRRQRGAAADILTGPGGIPATPTMGGVAK